MALCDLKNRGFRGAKIVLLLTIGTRKVYCHTEIKLATAVEKVVQRYFRRSCGRLRGTKSYRELLKIHVEWVFVRRCGCVKRFTPLQGRNRRWGTRHLGIPGR